MVGASGYINGRFGAASQISSLQRRRPFFTDSSLTPGSAVETPLAAGLGPLVATSLQTRSCAGKAAVYIARRPSHFGGLHSHMLACHRQAIGSFFFSRTKWTNEPMNQRTNERAVSLRDYKKASVEEGKKKFSHTSVFTTVLVPYLWEPRLR